jgi:hypothetical protein
MRVINIILFLALKFLSGDSAILTVDFEWANFKRVYNKSYTNFTHEIQR